MAITGSSSSLAPDAAGAVADGAALAVIVGLPALEPGHAAALAAARAALDVYRPTLPGRIVVSRPRDAQAAPASAGPAADADVIDAPYATHPSDTLHVPFHGMQARARAVHAILREAQAHGAQVCVIADPRSPLTAAWIDALARPLLDDAVDLVEPIYRRHPFHGGLVHGIVYPLFRALYGRPVRYPLGGDFACSRATIEAVVDDPVWETDQAQLGIDWWLSATAIGRGLRVGQAYLGDRADERTGLDLSAVLTQVLGVGFSEMERRGASWHRVRETRDLPRFGEPPPTPAPPDVDAAALAESFRLGARTLEDVWAEVLPPLAILQWRRLAAARGVPRVDDALWARTIYDFAIGHRLRVIARDHLLASLAPLYLGWLASFVDEVQRQPPEAAEARIERLGRVFEAEKPYVISQWRWPERFKPMKAHR